MLSHHDGDDWLFRPVLAGLCRAESLDNGSLTLGMIARLNAAMDIRAKNDELVADYRRANGHAG